MAIGFELEMPQVAIMLMRDFDLDKNYCNDKATGTTTCWQGYNSSGGFTEFFFKRKDYYKQTLFKWMNRAGKTTIEVSMDTSVRGRGEVLTLEQEQDLGALAYAQSKWRGGLHYPCPELVIRPLDLAWSTPHRDSCRKCTKIMDKLNETRRRPKSIGEIVSELEEQELNLGEEIEIGRSDCGKKYDDLMLGFIGPNKPHRFARLPENVKVQATFGVPLNRVHQLLLRLTYDADFFQRGSTDLAIKSMHEETLKTLIRFNGSKNRLSREHIGQLDGLRLLMECYYGFLTNKKASESITIRKGYVAFLLKSELYRMHHLCLNPKEQTRAKKLYKKLQETKQYKSSKKENKEIFERIYGAGLLGKREKGYQMSSKYMDVFDEILPEPVGKVMSHAKGFSGRTKIPKKRRSGGQWYVVDDGILVDETSRLIDETTNFTWKKKIKKAEAMTGMKRYENKPAERIARLGPVMELRHMPMTNKGYKRFLEGGDDGDYTVKSILKKMRGVTGREDGETVSVEQWKRRFKQKISKLEKNLDTKSRIFR